MALHTESETGSSLQPGAPEVSSTTHPKPLTPCEYQSPGEEMEETEWQAAADSQPFIGELISLEDLIPEFIPGSNAHKKMLYLASLHENSPQQQEHQQHRGESAKVRRVRRDGCCFYRSYMFGVFEQLAGKTTEVEALKALVDGALAPRMEATGLVPLL